MRISRTSRSSSSDSLTHCAISTTSVALSSLYEVKTGWGCDELVRRVPTRLQLTKAAFPAFDVARIAELRAADLVVLKVAKSGGVTNCFKSAVVSEAHGMGLLGSGPD